MANELVKITALPAGTPANTDVVPYVDLGTGVTKKALKSDLKGDAGNTGATGAAGAAATIAVGTTTTGAAGSSASVNNSGSSSAATFNFTIPRGDTGATGAAGSNGLITAVSIATANGFSGSSSGGATPALTINAITSASVLSWTGLKPGTDGEIPTFDASGNPAFVAVGTATHVLTSNGTGAAPTFQAAAGGGAISTVKVSLSAANIIAMFATPFELIAAPGAGKFIAPLMMVFSFTYGGVAFTGGGGITTQTATDTFDGNNNVVKNVILGAVSGVVQNNLDYQLTNITRVANEALTISNLTGAFATGDGTMDVTITYQVVTY